MPEPLDPRLPRMLGFAVSQRDRAVKLLRELDDPRALQLVEALDQEQAELRVELAPSPPSTELQVVARVQAPASRPSPLEARLEVAYHLARGLQALVAWTLLFDRRNRTFAGNPTTTFQEVALALTKPKLRAALFKHLDYLARSSQSPEGDLWLESRAYIAAWDV